MLKEKYEKEILKTNEELTIKKKLHRKDRENNELRKEIKHLSRQIKYISNPEAFYSHKYFTRHFEYMREWEMKLGKDLVDRYHIKSLVDFGCGCGSYLEGAKEAGSEVKGFELMYDIISKIVPPETLSFIEHGDVMSPIDCGIFDCSMSIETAEHILPENTEIFVDNLVNASSRLIIFTAARPGQGGTGHINFKPKEEWIELFNKRECLYLDEEVSITQDLWKKRLARKFRYLIRNLMIFNK